MRRKRPAAERGQTRLGWLDSRHGFSFGSYSDPAWTSFRSLRVMNDDRIAPSGGFATHPHRDMEILTWVTAGAIAHRDSMGNEQLVRTGEMQRMTAGTGVTHSEFNPSDREALRLFQIWLLPEREGLPPSYEQTAIRPDEHPGTWLLAASRDGRDGSLTIHQDAELRVASLRPGDELVHEIAPGRHAWLQVTQGSLRADGLLLEDGDGLALSEETSLVVEGAGDGAGSGAGAAELMLFDLA